LFVAGSKLVFEPASDSKILQENENTLENPLNTLAHVLKLAISRNQMLTPISILK
jgi:hypothetical protein